MHKRGSPYMHVEIINNKLIKHLIIGPLILNRAHGLVQSLKLAMRTASSK